MSTHQTPPQFSPLSAAALEEFAEVRNFISGVAGGLANGGPLTQTARDLPVLQAIADRMVSQQASHGTWVALGVTFGDALVDCVPGLAWRFVTDQDGTQAALQYRAKAVSIAAPTLLWKRFEQGEAIDLRHIANHINSYLEDHADDFGDA